MVSIIANTNNSIQYNYLFVHSEVVTSIAIKHLIFYSTLLICLHTLKWLQVLLCITNNSIKHQSFVYIQLNVQTVLFHIIQFRINHLFALSLNVEQFYLTH